VPGIDAIAIELARATGRDDDRGRKKCGQAKRVFGSTPFGRHRQHADGAWLVAGRDQKSDASRVVEDWDVETDCLASQYLDHKPGSSGTATRGATNLVVIGLVA